MAEPVQDIRVDITSDSSAAIEALKHVSARLKTFDKNAAAAAHGATRLDSAMRRSARAAAVFEGRTKQVTQAQRALAHAKQSAEAALASGNAESIKAARAAIRLGQAALQTARAKHTVASAALKAAQGQARLAQEFEDTVSRARQAATATEQVTSANSNMARSAGKAAKAAIQSNAAIGRSAGAMRASIQNAAFQVGDLATQLELGVSPARAFAQQGSQLLGAFGPLGAVLGGVVAVAVPLAVGMKNLATQGKDVTRVFGTLQPLAQGVAEAFGKTGPLVRSVAETVINHLDRLLVTGGLVAGFFATKWVAAFAAARVATLSLVGTLGLLKTTLIRLGIGALIVGLGELIYQFTRVAQAAGAAGAAFKLLGDATVGVIKYMMDNWRTLPLRVSAVYERMVAVVSEKMARLVNHLQGPMNAIIGAFVGAKNAIIVAFEALPAAFLRIGRQVVNALIDTLERGLSVVVEGINQLLSSVAAPIIPAIDLSAFKLSVGEAVDLTGDMSEAFRKAFEKDYAKPLSKDLKSVAKQAAVAAKKLDALADNLVKAGSKKHLAAFRKLRDLLSSLATEDSQTIKLFGENTEDFGDAVGQRADDMEAATERVVKSLRTQREVVEQTHAAETAALKQATDEQLKILGGRAEAVQRLAKRQRDEMAKLSQTAQNKFGEISNALQSLQNIGNIFNGSTGKLGQLAGFFGSAGSVGSSGSSSSLLSGLSSVSRLFSSTGILGSSGIFSATGALSGVGSVFTKITGGIFTKAGAIGKLFASGGAFAGLGSVLSVLGPIAAIAAIAGPLIKKAFGREYKYSGIKGTLRDTGLEGHTYDFYKGGLFRSDKTKRKFLDPATSASLNEIVRGVQGVLTESAQTLGLKFDRALKTTIRSFDIRTKDKSQEQITQELTQQITDYGNAVADAIVNTQAFEGITGNIADHIGQLTEGLDGIVSVVGSNVNLQLSGLKAYQRGTEGSLETLTRLAQALTSVNEHFGVLGRRIRYAGLAGASTAQQLVDAFGGIQAMQQSTAVYLDRFHSSVEKTAMLTKDMSDVFTELGLVMPKTRVAFRELVESQNLATESGRNMHAALLNLAGVMDKVYQNTRQAWTLGSGGESFGLFMRIADAVGRHSKQARTALSLFKEQATAEGRAAYLSDLARERARTGTFAQYVLARTDAYRLEMKARSAEERLRKIAEDLGLIIKDAGTGFKASIDAAAQAAPKGPLRVRLTGIAQDQMYTGQQIGELLNRLQDEARDRGIIISAVA